MDMLCGRAPFREEIRGLRPDALVVERAKEVSIAECATASAKGRGGDVVPASK